MCSSSSWNRTGATGEVLRTVVQNVPDEAMPILARYERERMHATDGRRDHASNLSIDVRDVLAGDHDADADHAHER